MEATTQRQLPAPLSHVAFGAARLRSLASAAGFAGREDEVVSLFRDLLGPWGTRAIKSGPSFPSDIGEDHTPYEFSIALGGENPELRLLVEAQGNAPTLSSYWEAGQALNEKIEREYGADLSRFRMIEDLFTPGPEATSFAMWHAVCCWPGKAPEFKLYLNPQVQGRERAASIVEEALCRLGFADAWSVLCQATRRGPSLDEVKYFAIDLKPGKKARVKVYFRHYEVTTEQLEQALSIARSHQPGDARTLCRDLLGTEGPFSSKPFCTCFSLVEGDERPSAATLYLPLTHYATHDAQIHERLGDFLRAQGLPVARYEESLRAFANRPLRQGLGMHSYAAFRRESQKPRLTVYFGLEAFRVLPPGQAEDNFQPFLRTQTRLVEHFEQNDIIYNPFFMRLGREPVSLGRLALLIENARDGLTRDFARRLASLVARVPSEKARCILAKQLNDELGNGKYQHSHALLFEQMLEKFGPWRPKHLTEASFAPGRALWSALEALYADPDPYVGIGAAIVMEVYGRQIDQRVGREVLRQRELDPASLVWLNLHQELEEEHVDESRVLAQIVPEEGLAAAWRGALATEAAMVTFFDMSYRACFSENFRRE